MGLQKCFCSLSSKYPKLIPHIFQNANHRSTITLWTAERKELRRMYSSLSGKVCASAETSFSDAILKDGTLVQHHPLKFEDMHFDKPVPHEDLINALYKCKTVSEQMEMLSSTLSLCPDDVRNRIKFCKTLEALFKPFFNGFKIQIFGSTVNGFGFKGCDIDLSFETSTDKEKVETSSDERKLSIDEINVPLVSEVKSGIITPKELSNLPPKVKLLFIHNVLLEYYSESKEPPIYISCHVPLIRFHHDEFGLKCDLTYKNNVAFANTKLLYLYYKIDNRVAPFIMTVRYWAKHHEIIGKGLKFNSYTISLLAIFFLQTRNPPILPSAESILELSANFKDEDMNDNSFLRILEKIPPSKNEQSLEQLLKEFFFYYSYFDFDQIILPMTSTSVTKEKFKAQGDNSEFRISTFSIQDPMCLKHNVAELVKYEFCVDFGHEMLKACNIFLKDDILQPSSSPWGLITLLEVPENSYKDLVKSKVVSLSIPLLSKSNDSNFPDNKIIPHTAETILKILDAFLCTHKHLKPSDYLNLLKIQDKLIFKHKKIIEAVTKYKNNFIQANTSRVDKSVYEQFQKSCAGNKLIFCVECTLTKNILNNRYLIKLDSTSDSQTVLERERSISSQVAAMNPEKKPYVFLCDCFVAKDSPETLTLNFRPCRKEYFNPIVGIFFNENIPKIMRNLNKLNLSVT